MVTRHARRQPDFPDPQKYARLCTVLVMAAGDAQRVWFPEMVQRLRSKWHQGMSLDALVELRDDLDAMLQQIRSERHIRTPVMKCPRCGYVGEGAPPHVSVRAMLLSLLRFGIADPECTKALEKAWAMHRRQYGLDLHGKCAGAPAAKPARCFHPQVR